LFSSKTQRFASLKRLNFEDGGTFWFMKDNPSFGKQQVKQQDLFTKALTLPYQLSSVCDCMITRNSANLEGAITPCSSQCALYNLAGSIITQDHGKRIRVLCREKQEESICPDCNNKATHYCSEQQCMRNLCGGCPVNHNSKQRTKDYKMLPLEQERKVTALIVQEFFNHAVLKMPLWIYIVLRLRASERKLQEDSEWKSQETLLPLRAAHSLHQCWICTARMPFSLMQACSVTPRKLVKEYMCLKRWCLTVKDSSSKTGGIRLAFSTKFGAHSALKDQSHEI